jgi:hypothetical protein
MGSTDEWRRRLFAPWPRTAAHGASLKIAERHGALGSDSLVDGDALESAAPRPRSWSVSVAQSVSLARKKRGWSCGRQSFERTVAPRFPERRRGTQWGPAILGATSSFAARRHLSQRDVIFRSAKPGTAETLQASGCVSRPGRGKPRDSLRAPGFDRRTLEPRGTPRRKARRRRVPCDPGLSIEGRRAALAHPRRAGHPWA